MSGHADKFRGKADVTGTLTKGLSQFRIDHPLDPENRCLMQPLSSPRKIVCRNGSMPYAEAIRHALPDATQVSDRCQAVLR